MKYKGYQGKEVRVYKRMPQGYKAIDGSTTAPAGTMWVRKGTPFTRGRDGKMHANPNYKHALVVRDEKQMIGRIAERRRRGEDDRFVADQATEKKIRSEMRRQA